MSLTNLFKKEAKITIATDIKTKLFESPPFSIRYELTQSISSVTKVICQLYNPNDDTIAMCEAYKIAGIKQYPTCEIQAGYENNISIAATGNIKNFDVLRQSQDRILQIEIFDNVQWYDQIVSKTYKQQTKASIILNDIIGDRPAQIRLGNDKLMHKGFVVKTIYSGVKAIAKETNSNFALRNGTLIMEPKGFDPRRIIKLDFTTGLINVPEKIDRPASKNGKKQAFSGYGIKTLYINDLNIWSSIQVTWGANMEKQFTGVIENVDQKFSTFENSESNYEVRV